jgi:hypothetical protein
MTNFPSLTDHLLVLLFGWGIPLLSSLQGRKTLGRIHFSEYVRGRFYLSNSLTLAFFAAIVLASWRAQGRPFEEMGFRYVGQDSGLSLTLLLTTLLLGLYGLDLWTGIRRAGLDPLERSRLLTRTPFLPRLPRELPRYILMCASAGVFEEVIYRGFMVTYFLPEPNGRTGWPWLAVTIPALLFSLAHHYQGWEAMAKVFLLSMLLALIFILCGSLWWVMGVHFLIDLSAGLATMPLMRRADRESAEQVATQDGEKDH